MPNILGAITKGAKVADKVIAPAEKIIVSANGKPITYMVKGRPYVFDSGKYTKAEVMDVIAEKELALEEAAKAPPKQAPGTYRDTDTGEVVRYDEAGNRAVVAPKPAMTSKVVPKPASKDFRQKFVDEFMGEVTWTQGSYDGSKGDAGSRSQRLHGAPTTVPTNIKGRPLKDALEFIADRWGKNATAMENVYANLAKGMILKNRDFVNETKFVISGNKDPASGNYGGLYLSDALSKEGPMIHVPEITTRFSSPEQVMYVVMHEAGHGATVREVDNSAAVGRDFDNLLQWSFMVLNDNLPQGRSPGLFAVSDRSEYGWKNRLEFIAEAFSNSKFKAILKEINKADGTNAYAEFRRLVAPYLGAAGVAMTPEIEQALDTIIDAKDEAPKDGA